MSFQGRFMKIVGFFSLSCQWIMELHTITCMLMLQLGCQKFGVHQKLSLQQGLNWHMYWIDTSWMCSFDISDAYAWRFFGSQMHLSYANLEKEQSKDIFENTDIFYLIYRWEVKITGCIKSFRALVKFLSHIIIF